jgi:hypothetical protein
MHIFSIITCVSTVLISAHGVLAQPTGHYTVPDVVAAFNDISTDFEPLIVNRGTVGTTGPICKHYQGIARYDNPADGTPYLYVSRSGNTTQSCPLTSDEPGALEVIRLGSRRTDGERLGTNLTQRGTSQFLSTPPVEDFVEYSMRFTGILEPAWMHPGGMQIIDDVMVVAMETRWPNGGDGEVLFYDLTTPDRPRLMHQIAKGTFGPQPGMVAITKNPATGTYWMMIPQGFKLHFYEIPVTDLFADDLGLYTLKSTPITDNAFDTYDAEGMIADPSVLEGWQDWQTLNFIRQDDGALFLLGMQRTTPLFGTNLMQLYEVVTTQNGEIELFNRGTKEVNSAELSASGGVHVSPTGELILYSTLLNEGTADSPVGPIGDSGILIHEWRSSVLRLQNNGVEPRSPVWAEIRRPGRSLTLESVNFVHENWNSLQSEFFDNEPTFAIANTPAGQTMAVYPVNDYVGQPLLAGGSGLPFIVDLKNNFSPLMSIFAGRMQIDTQFSGNPFIDELNRLGRDPAYQGTLEAQFFRQVQGFVSPFLECTAPGREILLLPRPNNETLLLP